ncbi:MAG: hypothetical protein EA361_14040 [Bacteroidetes bacterium]|nr:MAG: hypothetical protein EA361_14040 [Bacteroidota bacterium]
MSIEKNDTGFAIALAWPQTWCKQPNAWYDNLMLRLGISKNHYYRAGHAALVLIEKSSGNCHYFDFGRYHAPFEHGRVRSAVTDHDLDLPVSALIAADGNSLVNFTEILAFLHQNQACHGNGDLLGSYTEVDFQRAYHKALEMQQQSPLPYGPFVHNGTNCSRFVDTVIRAGQPPIKHTLKMKYNVPLTPTPMSNVNALAHKTRISAPQPWELFYPFRILAKSELSGTLPKPKPNGNIPVGAKWLSGEGAGSWFHIAKREDGHYHITRYSPEGVVECNSIFCNDAAFDFDPALPFEVVHTSHCAQVRVVQNKQRIILARIQVAGSPWRELHVPGVGQELSAC